MSVARVVAATVWVAVLSSPVQAQDEARKGYNAQRVGYMARHPEMRRDRWPVEAILKDEARALTVPLLEGWEQHTCKGQARLCLKHPSTHSQIEFIVSDIPADNGEMYLRVYLEALGKSGMQHEGQDRVEFGGNSYRRYRYSFLSSGVHIIITSHYFVSGSEAWLVVSYTPADEEEGVASDVTFILVQSVWEAAVTPR